MLRSSAGLKFAFPMLLGLLAALSPSAANAACVPNATTLCIDQLPGDGRFSVTLAWDTTLNGGSSGQAHALPLASIGVNRGGMFWIFTADNPEVVVKVLDGCGYNGNAWVYYSAVTNVGFTLTVTDTQFPTHVWTHVNPDLHLADSEADIEAFTCDGSEPQPADIVEFSAPGVFLDCTPQNKDYRFFMPFPAEREFEKVEIQFDVYIAGWDPDNPGGYHNLLWFQNGPSWNNDMMVYMNIRPQNNDVRVEANVGNGTESNRTPAPTPGEWYHVLWESNLTGIHQFYYRITRLADGHIVQQKLLDNSYRHFIAATDGFLSVGSQSGSGIEANTYGWKFRNLQVKYFESGL